MSEPERLSPRLQELTEDYLDGLLDEPDLQELEHYLCADPRARHHFVIYAQLHTDLHLEVRARKAGERALEGIDRARKAHHGLAISTDTAPARKTTRFGLFEAMLRRSLAPRNVAIAAGLFLAISAGWWLALKWINEYGFKNEPAVAWLVNAQDCTWSGLGPTGNLQAGKLLKIERGLAEIHFQCGARVILEGPSVIELISSKSARLTSGKLTARVPATAIGFEIISPQGKVIDLGTEFGVRSNNGLTEVYVFEGKVEALSARDGRATAQTVNVTQHQAAQMTLDQVTVGPIPPAAAESQFVRTIVSSPVIVPRTKRLTFNRAVDGSIRDLAGLGTGLTHRLPGTGKLLLESDRNLRLDLALSQLQLTTTNSDLNTQYKLHEGEYLGVRLADFGFTGKEDFAATVTIADIPALGDVGQFGLYAGARSDRSIRGGLIGHDKDPEKYTQFLVNNDKGCDTPDVNMVGLLSTGTDLRLTLKRIGGKYSLTVENLTAGSTSTLTIRHPDFLDAENDLYVGLFGANTQSVVRKTLIFREFQATVWTVASPGPR